MVYKLADRVQLVCFDERVFLIDDEMMELEGCSPAQYEALQLLKQGCREEEINAVLQAIDRQELFEFLECQGLLRNNWSNEYEGDIVEKQIYYLDDFSNQPNAVQKQLGQATVAVIGVGGVGSVVLQHLIGAGVKSFILIDQDHVQRNNQNRQFIYGNSVLGHSKVEAAKDYLHQIDSAVQVTTYQLMVDSVDRLSVLDSHEVDLVINAADQPAHLYQIINQYCTKRQLPWIAAGVGRHVGSWGPMVIPGETVCMECFYKWEDEGMDELEREIRNRIQPTIQASFGATNTVISALLAKDAILYLALRDVAHVASAGTRCIMNFKTLEVTRVAIDESVASCTCWKGAAECHTTE